MVAQEERFPFLAGVCCCRCGGFPYGIPGVPENVDAVATVIFHLTGATEAPGFGLNSLIPQIGPRSSHSKAV
jgi:hypothetical protein